MSKSDMVYSAVSSAIGRLGTDNPDNPANLARLRRGVGKKIEDSPESWAFVLAGLPDELLSSSIEEARATESEIAVHIALTLYAVHQQSSTIDANRHGISFGTAIRSLVPPGDKDAEDRMIRRFNAVITSSGIEELAYHARGLVQLMRSAEPPIGFDYPMFAKDLYNFQFPDGRRSAILRWGQDFYRIDKPQDKKKEND